MNIRINKIKKRRKKPFCDESPYPEKLQKCKNIYIYIPLWKLTPTYKGSYQNKLDKNET